MMFLRGARIIQFLAEDSTFNQLLGNIETNFDTTKRQHDVNSAVVGAIKYVPYVQDRILQVNSDVRGTSGNYHVVVQFLNVNFQPTPENGVSFTAVDGTQYTVQPISLEATNVKVNCSCMDFYFRFAMWNFNNDSLAGAMPQPYQRKTTTRPPVNPSRVPGVCKHIIATFDKVDQIGLTY